MIWLTIIVFIVLLLVLVLAHEFGHFWTAKKAGCKVEEFGFGFPPRIAAIQKGETTYSFNLLPIGGFVKIEGEDMEEDSPSPTSMASKSAGWRVFILSAGVLMNILLAYLLLSIQSVVGTPTIVTDSNASQLKDIQTYLVEVAPGSPAELAGVKQFDRVVELNGEETPTVETVRQITSENLGEPVNLKVDRQGIKHDIVLTPRENPPEGEGAMGVTLASTGLERYPFWQVPWVGLKKTGQMLTAIVYQFGVIVQRLATSGSVGGDLTGPIGIAVYTNEVTNLGISYVLEFAALISINLAIINILPIPALDGGRILFVIFEKIRGKRITGNFERISHTVGFALLIALMVFIAFKDAQKYV